MPSSIEREHNEWLSLLPTSGPFLSMPVLKRVFPNGLDGVEPDLRHRLRTAYEQWVSDQESGEQNVALHTAWILFVLEKVLGMERESGNDGHRPGLLREGAAIPANLRHPGEHGLPLAPDYALCDPSTGQARLLMMSYPGQQGLDESVRGRVWPPTPADGMVDLLRYTGVPLGLLTNGEHWMLVYAIKGEETSFVSWQANLWLEDPITLRAFRSLLHQHRFFGVPAEDTLERMLAESALSQQEVTDQLGYQVRRAVSVLIRTLDRIDRDRGRELLREITPETLYEAALTVMMRLVFLLFAEERNLLPLGERLYDQNYAASTLLAQLQEVAGQRDEAFLEQKCDAWSRLLSLFRVVYGGISHQDLSLRPYDGRLFDPDRFPFLEGRAQSTGWREVEAQPLPVDNRTVLHLLFALQYLQVRSSGGMEARRLSFRALDIEQIGHVYEGLLDHTARRAAEPLLGLTVRGAKYTDEGVEISLARLEECLQAKGEDGLLDLLAEATGYPRERLKRDLAATPDVRRLERLRFACENDEALFQRVRPFAGLLRLNSFEEPVVILPGAFYMTQGTDRRTTGTHYTPRALTEPMVQYTLEPLVYEGPAEGRERTAWLLRSPRELLNLKVCDMAMGSGAFLVQTCRYLAQRLVESWEIVEQGYRSRVTITPEGELASGKLHEIIVPGDIEEREALARRLVAERCLYGVDKNPLAVEMAKLSLWLITLSKDRPFTFLDHALRPGDSLLGVSLDQLRTFSMEAGGKREAWISTFAAAEMEPALRHALEKRAELRARSDEDIAGIEEKKRLLAEAEQSMEMVRLGADILILSTLGEYGKRKDLDLRLDYAALINDYQQARQHPHPDFDARLQEVYRGLRQTVDAKLAERRPFHWFLELPEAFLEVKDNHISNGHTHGFDALLSNPPFQGGQRITGALSQDYREYLVENLASGKRGSADLCAYFFLRATSLVRRAGQCALLATNTIAQGDTREVGLDQILAAGWTIPRATPSRKWPGEASLEIAQIWLRHGDWQSAYLLEEQPVDGITSYLTPPGAVEGKPFRLVANENKSFQGSIVLGLGFVLQPEEAQALIQKDPRNRDVLFPYLNGEDLNSRPDQSPSRWVINFFDWDIEEAEKYPDCFQIIREKVKPERDKNKRKPRRENWWLFAERAPALYAAIAGMQRVLVRARIANVHSVSYVPNGWIYNEKVVVFVDCPFAVLQSSIHEIWARSHSSTLRTDMQYTPSDCFETFPFPLDTGGLESIGERYYQHRQSIMQARQEGLTATYNRFHNPREQAEDIVQLRELHREMDEAVAAAYGWRDLALEHGFYETRQGTRYTISEEARREVLGRLLRLNHERYAQEVAAGLHEKSAKATKARGQQAGSRKGGGQRARVTDIAAARSSRGARQRESRELGKVAENQAAYEIGGQIVKPRTLFDGEVVEQKSLFEQGEEQDHHA
ncbi:MAG TPA: DNA methyltransferase [Ktedonobacteraceae bacterium]|nr:DNA methyltransferase [Ktedonobacteraceae bacterium]